MIQQGEVNVLTSPASAPANSVYGENEWEPEPGTPDTKTSHTKNTTETGRLGIEAMIGCHRHGLDLLKLHS